MIRKLICILLVCILLSTIPLTAGATGDPQVDAYAQSLIQYYLHYQEDAENVIWDIVNKMKLEDLQQADAWRNIMDDWSWINSAMPVYEGVLPDGLPQDDSLAIVVLGYALNEDGSMKEELVDRLVVALASALKYPNAWVVLTGGQTSEVKGATEAGQMAAWLQNKGIDKSRLIQEKQSLSTTANAENVYKLLTSHYPQVDSIAVVTSDYHITWGCAMFTTVSHYRSINGANRALKLVGNAVCNTGKTMNTLGSQAWGISLIAGLPYDGNAPAPELYYVDRPEEPVTEPTEAVIPTEAKHSWFWEKKETPQPQPQPAEETVQEQSVTGQRYVAAILVAIVLAAVYILLPKKSRRKRKRPEFKWE